MAAKNENDTPEYRALVKEIERQGGDIKLARDFYLKHQKNLEGMDIHAVNEARRNGVDILRIPPEERPWLRGVCEKRARETALEVFPEGTE